MADNKLTTADKNSRITEPLTMEDINSRVKELEGQLKRINETVENTHSNLLEQINQINDMLETLKQKITPFQESSDATMTNSIKKQLSCTIVFGGASFGNPGPAGAGALLLAEDCSVFYEYREGLGCQTKAVAEYRALILGLKQAIKKGFKHIIVKGDSELVINQSVEPWQINDVHLRSLCDEALKLRSNFYSCTFDLIPREQNGGANSNASQAMINLNDGQVEEELLGPPFT